MMETTAAGDRAFRHEHRSYDLVVVGGGMAGIAAAVLAAREGAHVALIQDRPVLGGNASTEVRVSLEGANGGAHNRFFVESGLAEDLLLLNLWRNPTGSADHWSALLLDMVLAEKSLTLYLDTVVQGVQTGDGGVVTTVEALTLASERRWTFAGRYFVDATGDGTVAYLAGAAYMRGQESRTTFGEPSAPLEGNALSLGGTMQFMCRDVGRPVYFEPPAFARTVSRDELRVHRRPDIWEQDPVLGGFWWIEYGGGLDTISDNPDIKMTLLSEVFGLWNHVKNSPEWKEKNLNLDLMWVGTLPGKRESRRVVGDYILREQDLVEGRRFDDAVAFGGWSIDDHPPLGFLDADKPPSVHYHVRDVYQIPLRCLYAHDIPNLYLAGRDISYSHLACCSARVMITCLDCGEAVGVAAALSVATGKPPREIVADPTLMSEVQRRLQRHGHYIHFEPQEADRVPPTATACASSEGQLVHEPGTARVNLAQPRLLSLPLTAGRLDVVSLWLEAGEPFGLEWRAYGQDRRGSWLPGDLLARGRMECPALPKGRWVDLTLGLDGLPTGYIHVGFQADHDGVAAGATMERPLGPLTWRSGVADLDALPPDPRTDPDWSLARLFTRDDATSKWGAVYSSPWRRDGHGWGGPEGPALAFRALPEQTMGAAAQVLEPYERPTLAGIHGWVSAPCEGREQDGTFVFSTPEWLQVDLGETMHVDRVELYFNSDVDRHLVNVWYSYPPGERTVPTVVASFRVDGQAPDGCWTTLAEIDGNYQRRREVSVGQEIKALRVTCLTTHGARYASIVDVRVRTRVSAASAT